MAWFFDTTVTVLSLHTLKTMIHELRCGIEAHYKTLPHGVAYEDVKSWIRLLSLFRSQVLVLQKFASLPELSDLVTTFVMLLSLLLVVFTRILHGISPSQSTMIPFAVIAVLFAFIRLFGKAYVAELITEQEEKIAIAVIEMQSNDINTRLEMKILVDLIMTNPIKVTFFNVVVFNRRLMLSLVSQLAAYLVVLLQFKASMT